MVFFGDTGVLVAFSALDRLNLLRAVCGKICVPEAVKREIVDQGEGWADAEAIQRAIRAAEWVETCVIPLERRIPGLRQHFERRDGKVCGEVEVIEGALWRDGVAMLDDKEARIYAGKLGIRFMGVLGMIGAARSAGVIDRCEPLVYALLEKGFRYKPVLVESFLKKHGE